MSGTAGSLLAACTAHIRELSKPSGRSDKDHYRTLLNHEFGRFRLWTYGFDKTPPVEGTILDEVLEEARHLKEPTILLLASFASCLLGETLLKVGNKYTRALLRLSLREVNKAYPHLEDTLKCEWKTKDSSIGELRECNDALFDLLSTLDTVLEEIDWDMAPLHDPVQPLTGLDPLRTGNDIALQGMPPEFGEVPGVPEALLANCSPLPGEGISTGKNSVTVAGSLVAGSLVAGASSDRDDYRSLGEGREGQELLERFIREELPACPVLITGMQWEIYEQYIRDKFPQAIKELNIAGFAKGNAQCYESLVKDVWGKDDVLEAEGEDGNKKLVEKEVEEKEGVGSEELKTGEEGYESLVYRTCGLQASPQLAALPEEPVVDEEPAHNIVKATTGPASRGVPETFKDSGLGSSGLGSFPPPTHASNSIYSHSVQPARSALSSRFLAPPPPVSVFSESTICSTASQPANRRLLPRLPEHSRGSSSFPCPFCGRKLRPITQGHAWRKHVFADLKPYMCIRSRCPQAGTFYISKKDWVAHDTRCIGDASGDSGETTTGRCPFCLKDFARDRGRFYSHVSHHMEDIRLFALPPAFREDHVGEYEDSSGMGSSEYSGPIGEYIANNKVVDTSTTREWAIKAGEDVAGGALSTDIIPERASLSSPLVGESLRVALLSVFSGMGDSDVDSDVDSDRFD